MIYVTKIVFISVLVPKLKENDPNPGVTIAVLTAIGDLAQVSESEMRLWSPELLPLLLDMLWSSLHTTLARRKPSLQGSG